MQPSPSSWRSALRAAFPHTVPILAGFLVLGATYGMLMQAIGYGPLWSGLFSAIAFGGSTQYAAVPLLAAGFDPLEVFLLSLTISARAPVLQRVHAEKIRRSGLEALDAVLYSLRRRLSPWSPPWSRRRAWTPENSISPSPC